MTLSTGYLTATQKIVWDLKSTGIPEASVAKKLKVTRQTIHKALDIANLKITKSLEETAKINKIKIETINPAKAFYLVTACTFKQERSLLFLLKMGSKSGTNMRAIARTVNS
jgi:DNA-binding CsgD family transcriptional regulator